AREINSNEADTQVAARRDIPRSVPYVEHVAFAADSFNRCTHDVTSSRRDVASDERYALDGDSSRPQLRNRGVTPTAGGDPNRNPAGREFLDDLAGPRHRRDRHVDHARRRWKRRGRWRRR